MFCDPPWLSWFGFRDRKAFIQSVPRMMAWDFDHLVVGHGDVIDAGAKAKLAAALARAGLVP